MAKKAWQIARLPDDEEERLEALDNYQILDTPPEIVFDRITRMAAKRFNMPIALVSLVDENRQWFKSRYGLDAEETPRELAFCSHVILQDDVMVVPDTAYDPRFAKNPLVAGSPDIRFYAGAPLTTQTGFKLGTVCVIDRIPHPDFTDDQKKELAELAAIVVDEMELRIAIKRVHRDLEALKAAQQALDEARVKAEQVTHEKSQFIANISHELRTPMNGILGMAYLLGDTKLDAQQQEYINTINHSAQNLLLLINDVLDLSKIQANELMLERTAFDIRTSFIQTVKLLTPLADRKNNRLLFEVDEKVPNIVVGDPGRFAQIVTNLVGNAVKFTEDGLVQAKLRYNPEYNSMFCEVIDNGIGITDNKKEIIFEKFIQGDAAITQKFGGTGLGLAITKQLVIMLGGQIGFESQEKKGSRFWFSLPVGMPETASAKQAAPAPAMQETNRIAAPEARVLVAEDNPVNQLFIVKLLKKFGFTTIDVAENGVEVLEKVTSDRGYYDAIFMDCRMPEKDGYEATEGIRAWERTLKKPYRTPIIAMTANALAGDREICFESGMDEYLTKPLRPELLKPTLGRWFIFTGEGEGPSVQYFKEPPAAPCIEIARLALAADTDDEKKTLLALFFTIAYETIAIMQKSRRDEEFAQWNNSAHKLRGAAANLGIHDIEENCKKAEKADRLSYDGRSALVQKIKNELHALKTYLTQNHPNYL